jgi:hypothetical protein
MFIVEPVISLVMMIVFVGYVLYGNIMNLVYELIFLIEGGVLRLRRI